VYTERTLDYLERFNRHILFLSDKYFVIYDDLTCDQASTFTWLYHILEDTSYSQTVSGSETSFEYGVGDVLVEIHHIAHPGELTVDDLTSVTSYVNPQTGEDYTSQRLEKADGEDSVCEHNLWIYNTTPAAAFNFLTVIYPKPPGESIPNITRLDDKSVQVGDDVICFDPTSEYASAADFLVETRLFDGTWIGVTMVSEYTTVTVSGAHVTYTVEFTEPVSGFTSASLSVVGTATGSSITDFTELTSGLRWNVEVTAGIGADATLRLALSGYGGITDTDTSTKAINGDGDGASILGTEIPVNVAYGVYTTRKVYVGGGGFYVWDEE